ncbi:SAG-related sequence SRS16C [Besnoitia besnoiti]|uniref:SAG-related sequence SRS16C n=1 Tax=Besnoitia besnoiti TaxID=94643 RepID=A0A2A9MG75_BESBE|nr:SAG-related sequence SRS16C [Besnoitia besnoiti]PFH36174.1 SAG-related sequence SRS16C [Besnoitia besnoiti]
MTSKSISRNCSARLRWRARKLLTVCVGGVLLFSGASAVAAGVSGRPAPKTDGNARPPNVEGQVASCALAAPPEQDGESTPATIVISAGNLSATLNCDGEGNVVVPSNCEEVCDANVDTIENCKQQSSEEAKRVSLASLLGSSVAIRAKVTDRSSEDTPKGVTWTLELEDSQLPLSDKSFSVGCQKKQGETNSQCKLNVTVMARSSSVDSNAVTCAYGPQSNGATPLTVEMTEETNKLAVDCGNEGSFAPLGYTQFCSPESQELKTCQTKEFSEIFPTFADTWWQKADQMKTVAELTIPKTDFPSEERQFLLGCVPMAASQENEGKDTVREAARGALAGLSECKVLVTVKAASSLSSSPSAFQMFVVSCGVAVLAGVFGGSY